MFWTLETRCTADMSHFPISLIKVRYESKHKARLTTSKYRRSDPPADSIYMRVCRAATHRMHQQMGHRDGQREGRIAALPYAPLTVGSVNNNFNKFKIVSDPNASHIIRFAASIYTKN